MAFNRDEIERQISNSVFSTCFLSSEDELDILLNGTPDQKKKLIREYLTGESESSSGDEFEKEMEAELSSTMKSLEYSWTASLTQGFTNTHSFCKLDSTITTVN